MSDFFHSFNAVRGIQASKPCFIAMCPLRIIPKIFVFDEDEVPPEMRAQRKLNKSRLPEIANYLIENRNNYTLSSLTASIDGDTIFEPVNEFNPNMGTLKISMDARLLINDGQHRRAAIEEAISSVPELGHDHISVVFFLDNGLEQSQQMFADLNKHAVRPSPSLSTLYDQREELSIAAKKIMNGVKVFSVLTETEKTSISNRSIKLFTLSSIKNATKYLLNKGKNEPISSDEINQAIEFWKVVTEQITDWQVAYYRNVNSSELRENFIHAHAVFLQAMGIVGACVLNNKHKLLKLNNLSSIDWSRRSNLWNGRAVINGRISKSLTSVKLTSNKIKELIGLELTDSEKQLEKEIKT